jgi:hypothetical protein
MSDGLRISHLKESLATLTPVEENLSRSAVFGTDHHDTYGETLEDAKQKIEVLLFLPTRCSLEDRQLESLLEEVCYDPRFNGVGHGITPRCVRTGEV